MSVAAPTEISEEHSATTGLDAWRREARNFVRAFSGAFLFGIPLLYTMEMWWLGETSRPGDLMLVLIVMLVANFWFAVAVGFRRETTLYSKVEQSIDAVAVGVVAAVVVLLALNEISPDDPLPTILGKIVFQALPLSLGAALANAVFEGEQGRQGDDAGGDGGPPALGVWRALLSDLGASAIGAIFVSAAIAPTEEIPMLAARMEFANLIGIIGLTLVIGYIIVFASGFDRSMGEDRPHLFQHPITETCLSYLIALLVAYGALQLTQQFSPDAPPAYVLAQTIVLALPAMIGGAAGRIAI